MADVDRAFGTLIAQANAALQYNRDSEAMRLLDAALALKPADRDASSAKGGLLGKLGRFEDALVVFRQGLASNPGAAELHYNAAFALHCLGRYSEAAEEYAATLALQPNFPEALNNKGLVLQALGRYSEALLAFDAALKQRPVFPRALNNRGLSLAGLGRAEEAIASYDTALRYDARYPEALNNRGIAFHEMGRFREALADYASAAAMAPDWPEAHVNEAFTRLLLGEFERGLAQFEWRPMGRNGKAPRPSTRPEWRGEDLAGMTLLLTAEQGLGDTIQFSRLVPLLAAKGARIVLQVQPVLRALLCSLEGAATIVAVGDSIPAHDFQCALMSVPFVLGTRLSSIPANVPYLSAEAQRVSKWRERLRSVPPGRRIGIAWRGRPTAVVDSGRSIALEEFNPLAALRDIRLVSLQKDADVSEFASLPAGMTIETLDGLDAGEDAFLDTAAVMANLDLVVTSDTAVAHLAGALGRPAWLALKSVPEWRWLLEREDSPWYPSLRLFRQRRAGDWRDVFNRMAGALDGEAIHSHDA